MAMSTEQKIMSAVVRADMFLISAWKYALIILLMMGFALLVILKTRWK